MLVAWALAASTLAWAELEHEVKAAFVFQFLSYVEWPDEAFPDATSPFVVGVLGADDVSADLNELARGRSARGRPVEVRKVGDIESISGVHVLFVGHGAMSALPELARKQGVLLVSEAEGGLDRGAMINLLRAGDHVRFEVWPEAAERGGLKISSRMLSVAQFVKQGRP